MQSGDSDQSDLLRVERGAFGFDPRIIGGQDKLGTIGPMRLSHSS